MAKAALPAVFFFYWGVPPAPRPQKLRFAGVGLSLQFLACREAPVLRSTISLSRLIHALGFILFIPLYTLRDFRSIPYATISSPDCSTPHYITAVLLTNDNLH